MTEVLALQHTLQNHAEADSDVPDDSSTVSTSLFSVACHCFVGE